MDRVLGRAARRNGRRLRARRELPLDARRLDGAVRLGHLRRRLRPPGRGDGSLRPRSRRRDPARFTRPPDHGPGRPGDRRRPPGRVPDPCRGDPRLEPRPAAHVPRPRRRVGAPGRVRARGQAVALRHHEHVLRLPRARCAAAVEGYTARARDRAVLRGLDVRVARRARRQRLGLPARDAAAAPRPLLVHPSLFEPSLCPPGKEACFVEQIAPYELRDGGHEAWAT